jgi:hypothetical protein
MIEIVIIGDGDDPQDCSVREIHRFVEHDAAVLDMSLERGPLGETSAAGAARLKAAQPSTTA